MAIQVDNCTDIWNHHTNSTWLLRHVITNFSLRRMAPCLFVVIIKYTAIGTAYCNCVYFYLNSPSCTMLLQLGLMQSTAVTIELFILVINQLDAQNLFHNKFYFIPLQVSSICAHHQEVKIALHSLWYHHTYRCDDTRYWDKYTEMHNQPNVKILNCFTRLSKLLGLLIKIFSALNYVRWSMVSMALSHVS